jgi:hypothetical protein
MDVSKNWQITALVLFVSLVIVVCVAFGVSALFNLFLVALFLLFNIKYNVEQQRKNAECVDEMTWNEKRLIKLCLDSINDRHLLNNRRAKSILVKTCNEWIIETACFYLFELHGLKSSQVKIIRLFDDAYLQTAVAATEAAYQGAHSTSTENLKNNRGVVTYNHEIDQYQYWSALSQNELLAGALNPYQFNNPTVRYWEHRFKIFKLVREKEQTKETVAEIRKALYFLYNNAFDYEI